MSNMSITECWTGWSEWGECCGGCAGYRERSRDCTCGAPGCTECPGDNVEQEDCASQSKVCLLNQKTNSQFVVECGILCFFLAKLSFLIN